VVERQVQQPAVVPSVEDILKVLVQPPAPEPRGRSDSWEVRDRPTVARRVDYAAREAGSRSLGVAGEEFVVVTSNELQVSRQTAERFFIYRPFDFRQTPKMVVKSGAIDAGFGLVPSLFAARPL
jgi:hypothetical protein